MIHVDDRVDTRLRSNDSQLIWLVTVNPAGQPKPSLVWYWWDGETITVYSQPDTPKLANIRANPSVALHLEAEGPGRGEEVTIVSGQATVAEAAPPLTTNDGYVAKYLDRITNELSWSPEEFSERYSVTISIEPTRIRAW
jgi:PPOX class probable F420-dependent enzyme